MVLKMPCGSMRRPCRKSTHNVLQILRESECTFVHVCIKTPFWCSWSSWSHNSETSCLAYVGALEGKWDSLRDYVEKGVHFLGLCRLRGMRDCWLELLQESLNCEIIEYCNVIFCMYVHVHCMVMCTEDSENCRGRGL
jgi:hypothetical protein